MNDQARFIHMNGYLSSDRNQFQYSPTPEQIATMERAAENTFGLYVLLEDIPVEDLEPGPPHLGTYALIPNSDAWNLCEYATRHYRLRVSTIQKKLPGSFDIDGKRTAKNHSLVIINT